ncbi:MAG: ABC transporter permease, partial [Flavisolibacter sp.]|nr:ABC transporter permease [Flavisolibacter sp.]
MFRNYLKTALRNLLRYKGFSFINIASLSIGITGCLIIGLFVWDEKQYDKFIKGGENIFRIYQQRSNSSTNSPSANTPPMLATYAQQNFPEVDFTSRLLMWNGKMLFEKGDVRSFEEKGLIADSTFFKMFPLKFISGDSKTAMNAPASIIITEELAKKYFGNT